MNKLNLLIVVLLQSVFAVQSYGQEKNTALRIGDKLPDLPAFEVINYHQDSVHLSDFKGKLLILDFWNTWCSGCIASFPKLEKIQERFKDKVKILLVVSHQGATKQKYVDFFKMREEREMPINLPSVINDTLLIKLFPHKSLPHIVWVDQDGGIKSISEGIELNEINIEKILTDSNFSPRTREMADSSFEKYTKEKAMLIDGNGGQADSFMERSLLIKKSNIKSGGNIEIRRDSIFTRITLINMKLPYLFTAAFYARYPEKFNSLTGALLHKKFMCETNNELIKRAILLANRELTQSKELDEYYSYELMVQGNKTDNEMLDAMITDLNRLFKVNVRLEHRKISIIKLSVSDTTLLKKTTYNTDRPFSSVLKDGEWTNYLFTRTDIETMSQILNRYFDLPFIYFPSSRNLANYDMELRLCSNSDFGELKKELAKNGLRIKKQKVLTEVLIFGD